MLDEIIQIKLILKAFAEIVSAFSFVLVWWYNFHVCIDCVAFCVTFGYTNTRKVVSIWQLKQQMLIQG